MKVEGRLRRSAGAMQAGVSSPGSARGRLCNPRAGDGTAAASSGANDAKYCCAGKTMGGCEDRRAAGRRDGKRPGTWGASRTQAAGWKGARPASLAASAALDSLR